MKTIRSFRIDIKVPDDTSDYLIEEFLSYNDHHLWVGSAAQDKVEYLIESQSIIDDEKVHVELEYIDPVL